MSQYGQTQNFVKALHTVIQQNVANNSRGFQFILLFALMAEIEGVINVFYILEEMKQLAVDLGYPIPPGF